MEPAYASRFRVGGQYCSITRISHSYRRTASRTLTKQPSGLENGWLGAHIRNMKRERYEARALGWHVVRIDPNGTESTVEVWPEEKAKHRAAVLDQRAAESSEAEQKLPRKGRDE
jgi:hypothetical protein